MNRSKITSNKSEQKILTKTLINFDLLCIFNGIFLLNKI
jgi:hypothetical protein